MHARLERSEALPNRERSFSRFSEIGKSSPSHAMIARLAIDRDEQFTVQRVDLHEASFELDTLGFGRSQEPIGMIFTHELAVALANLFKSDRFREFESVKQRQVLRRPHENDPWTREVPVGSSRRAMGTLGRFSTILGARTQRARRFLRRSAGRRREEVAKDAQESRFATKFLDVAHRERSIDSHFGNERHGASRACHRVVGSTPAFRTCMQDSDPHGLFMVDPLATTRTPARIHYASSTRPTLANQTAAVMVAFSIRRRRGRFALRSLHAAIP